MFFFEQYTAAGVSTVIQVLCMILKMNISATFVVAYIQANPLYFSLTVFLFLNLISNFAVPDCHGWRSFVLISFSF